MNVPATPPELIPEWKKRIPMWLTWGRMAVCPPVVYLLSLPGDEWGWIIALIFIVASVTDWFDGSLARKYNAQTNLGKFMDPIADKVLVASVLIMLVPSGRVDPYVVLLLLTRDIVVGGVRAAAAADNMIIDAKTAGKWKTGFQMMGIPAILIYNPMFGLPIYQIGYACLWISVVLSLYSGVDYMRLYFRGK